MLEDKLLGFEKVHTAENWSNMMPKVILTKNFKNYCKGVGVVVPNYIGKGEICWVPSIIGGN